MKILIAEDDPLTILLYEIGLKKDDIRVCFNGVDFIMAYSSDYDVFILDLMMPIKNGFEVVDFLKGIGNKVPIVIVTAYGLIEAEAVAKLDVCLIIEKPIKASELRTKIEKYISCAS